MIIKKENVTKQDMERRNTMNAGLAYVLTHPTRRLIVTLLKKNEKLSVSQIASNLKLSEEIAGFHVVALEQHGLLSREMVFVNPRTRAEAQFSNTEKVRETVEAIQALA